MNRSAHWSPKKSIHLRLAPRSAYFIRLLHSWKLKMITTMYKNRYKCITQVLRSKIVHVSSKSLLLRRRQQRLRFRPVFCRYITKYRARTDSSFYDDLVAVNIPWRQASVYLFNKWKVSTKFENHFPQRFEELFNFFPSFRSTDFWFFWPHTHAYSMFAPFCISIKAKKYFGTKDTVQKFTFPHPYSS